MPIRVLIVEDDEILRWLLMETMKHLGHEATECADADTALLILNDNQAFDLVITDVVMPGHHDGIDLAKVIWSTRSHLPVVIVSGTTVFPSEFLPENARYIGKPYTLDILIRTIEELLSTQ